MSGAPKLRPAHDDDAAAIAAISLEVWTGTYLKRGVGRVFAEFALAEFTAKKTKALIGDEANLITVSENKEGIDGFIRLRKGSAGPTQACGDLEIATFYVQPRHHGRGIGRALLEAALDQARGMGASALWLSTNAENHPAIGFYLSHGFAQVGETEFVIDGTGYLNNVYARPLP